MKTETSARIGTLKYDVPVSLGNYDRPSDRSTDQQTNQPTADQSTDGHKIYWEAELSMIVNCFVDELMIDYAWRMDENRANEGDIDNKVR